MSGLRSDRKAQPISGLVDEVLSGVTVQKKRSSDALTRAWSVAAGEAIARHSRVVGLRQGTLQIAVQGAPLLHQLTQFRKRALLSALQKDPAGTGIRDLRFSMES